jgi:peptidoglycan/xylan/chitin deacetylase (PgdA/CDA1 family)
MDSVIDTKPIALGIDFEDIRHTPAYRALDKKRRIDVDIPGTTDKLLRLFDDYDTKVTFFIVTRLAEEYPDLIRRISREGHEIASHTRSHRSLPELTQEELREEIAGSKEDLESIVDCSIQGFRAPTCEIDSRAYRSLVSAGYNYSSSVMPSVPIPGFYSNNDEMPRKPSQVDIDNKTLSEFPITVAPGVRLPVSGAWIRLLGCQYVLRSIQYQSHSNVVCTYSHPWEFQRMEKPLPFRCRHRTGEWLWETYKRILKLDREFVTCSELYNRVAFNSTFTL